MAKITVGPFNKGLRNDRTAFVIDSDSFPVLINAYQWRGRVKRKRGTSFINRLRRFFNSASTAYSSIASINLVGGAANILTGFGITVLEPNANITIGSVVITDITAGQIYTDLTLDGILTGNLGGTGTINYATGDITIAGGGADLISVQFNYFPALPVMGIEDLELISTQFPGNILFDTRYSYNLVTAFPYPIYDVSFYKNPPADPINLPGYIPKAIPTPTTWNGEDYQQFWTTNYEGALWATNGIRIPFVSTKIGMQFKLITGIVGAFGVTPEIVNITIPNHGLVVGDFLFINEVVGITGINFQTGYVIAVVDINTVTVEFPFAFFSGAYISGGIAQYLTNRSDVTVDSLRWYDGDPTNGNVNIPGFAEGHGWVNFSPPLSEFPFSISGLPPRIYYLVGARIIIPFKDRLLFFGAVVGDSSGAVFYLQDTVIFSQNGTPYYTASYTNSPNAALDTPTHATNVFHPILVPDNQTATSTAYFEDQSGFGDFLSAGVSQPITSCSTNEDVLIVGFSMMQTKLVYTGNDLIPFNFYAINSELGTASTFSVINLDKGVVSRGTRSFTITTQVDAQRIDLEIPDEVFEISLTNNGNERFCSARDFINEWLYFTYTVNQDSEQIDKFPNQTLLYNYRDNSWAIFKESYTTYGYFRRQSGFTWQTAGLKYFSWEEWNDPWNAGTSTLLQQEVLAGNQQGFIIARDEGTAESNSLFITSFSNTTNIVTSPGHNLADNDFIFITGAIGTVAPLVNNKIFSVFDVTQNTFRLNPDPLITTETYFGGALVKKLYVPLIQTKQFQMAWGMGRKTRIGPQMYLLSTTDNAQITLLIFLSQNDASPYNFGKVYPNPASVNKSLIYSNILFTCPESTNLGLTPANVNLQMPTATQQQQIWHRINTSLIGDTVQLGFTLSDAQMRTVNDDGSFISQDDEIELHAFVLEVNPSQLLC